MSATEWLNSPPLTLRWYRSPRRAHAKVSSIPSFNRLAIALLVSSHLYIAIAIYRLRRESIRATAPAPVI